ncbi:hypothetical protein MATL_G00046230 [Megalops atlanticus]|uniref:DUF4683 domain-containing protein n=1 Tax=Megalops atlanticus TaxID=7932 RepID=A0A9D3TAJ5_MEGAT|nr:hypothetical protein MATL_G00046230 [Megalops atlanticus]
MDDLQETNLAVPAQNLTQVNGADERGTHEHGGNLKPYAAADAAVPLPSSAAAANAQRGSQECQRAALTPPSPLSLNEHAVPDESSTHAISLTSCTTKVVSPWSMPEDCDKAPFPMMVPGGISNLTGDCLMQPSRTCLGCFIETKDTPDSEPEINLKMGDMSREYDPCSIPDIGMQCMSSGDSSRFGDQLLSDQLLSYPEHKVRAMEKRDTEKSDSDSEDPTSKSIYEGLLLDKCNGEEALLTNPSQDWGCFESFISESKMELLDLCSKNELSVNLFSEEDVDNYMFDDDDDSTLSSDVCSLKIRYESFQDNVREKTNALQEEAQFNFFPSVLVNYAKKEGGAIRKNADGVQLKGDDVSLWGSEDKGDKSGISADGTPDVSSESNYLFDSNTSTEDSGEYSDDSSCTGSSYDTLREAKGSHRFLSRENSSSSSQLNYGLRAKRKVRYSEDYLYDVDSIESERNTEKREKQPAGPKEEEDDDWCPKKRRKSSRKEPPVVIKYIIVNRFKGERHMLVKARKIDPTDMTVSLNEDLLQNPKLVIQQSVDEVTPLRESTDLLDISNFTPDKFRHSSLSEMSPPDTPNLSPQVTGPEMKGGGKAKDFQDASEVALGSTAEMKWDCSAMPQQVQHGRAFTVDSHQFQFHTFNDDDGVGLAEKNTSFDGFDEQDNSIISGTKGPKSKKKTGKQNSALEQKGTKKTKAPRASKAERSKNPRQNSRSTKKIKALLDGKAAKGQAGGSKTPPKFRNNLISAAQSMTNTMTGSLTRLSGDWPSLKESGTGWSEGSSNLLDDDQREFEEPSNILSNIASGMAEVQRFMMASIEPLWSPGSGVCLPPEANSLKLKTLKILAGTPPDLKKKGVGTTNTGATRGRKSSGRGCKNQAKLNSSHLFFPPLALDCNMFDRPSLGIPGTNGPPHKKMYRHKTSAKFARDENSKGKRADPNKDLALMASFEKLR